MVIVCSYDCQLNVHSKLIILLFFGTGTHNFLRKKCVSVLSKIWTIHVDLPKQLYRHLGQYLGASKYIIRPINVACTLPKDHFITLLLIWNFLTSRHKIKCYIFIMWLNFIIMFFLCIFFKNISWVRENILLLIWHAKVIQLFKHGIVNGIVPLWYLKIICLECFAGYC